MKTMELRNLKSGDYVQSVRTGEVLEVVGMDTEAGKYMLSNGKVYSKSTIKRWFDVVEIPEVVEPDNTILDDIEQADELTSEQDTTADTDTVAPKFNLGDKVVTNFGVGEVVSVPHLVELDGKVTMSNYRVAIVEDGQRYLFDYKEEQLEAYTEQTAQDIDTTANTDTDTAVNEIQGDTEGTPNNHVIEGNTATIRQNNLIRDINNLMDLHDVQMEAKKEYIKVSIPGKRGALCMIRPTRFGTGIHIDFKSKILAKLDENYRGMLIEQYNCSIYDKTRGYYRVFDCSDLEVLRTIILTAKQVG